VKCALAFETQVALAQACHPQAELVAWAAGAGTALKVHHAD